MSEFIHSFQVDDEIVIRQRAENDNYVIHTRNIDVIGKKKCAIYFSSNDIYFPNNESAFRSSIIDKDYFEWQNCKIESAQKHIFIRDVNKQWYLSGINDRIATPNDLLSFLKKETDGFDIITIGSSAGGYAAILYGIQLGASQVFAFNAQLEINSLLGTDEKRNPLVFRLKDSEIRQFYDLVPFIKAKTHSTINYFVSICSPWDEKQLLHLTAENAESYLNIIRFDTSHHGIPFPKVALNNVLGNNQAALIADSKKIHSPIIYSINKIGFFNTIAGISTQLYRTLRKFIKRKLL